MWTSKGGEGRKRWECGGMGGMTSREGGWTGGGNGEETNGSILGKVMNIKIGDYVKVDY